MDSIGLVNDVDSSIKSILNSFFFQASVVLEKVDWEIIFVVPISRLESLAGFQEPEFDTL